MKIVTISSKRQITIPKDFLESLDLKPQAKAAIEKEENSLRLRPIKTSVVDEVAGSLTKYVSSSKLGVPFSKIETETKKKVARKLAQK